MARIKCRIVEDTIEEGGKTGRGVIATCLECDHATQSFGTGESSRKRCLVLMREECPNHDENFYVDEDA